LQKLIAPKMKVSLVNLVSKAILQSNTSTMEVRHLHLMQKITKVEELHLILKDLLLIYLINLILSQSFMSLTIKRSMMKNAKATQSVLSPSSPISMNQVQLSVLDTSSKFRRLLNRTASTHSLSSGFKLVINLT